MGDCILIIDDDKVIRKVLSRMIQITGISDQPLNFKDGVEAYNFLKAQSKSKQRFVLFLDINMPNMNGWQLLDSMEKDELMCNKLIYIITSSIDIDDYLKAENNDHIIDVITKPVTIKKLKALLKNIGQKSNI
ncbi:MAG: response regulator [Leeuwenhoekiella sp.]